MPKYYSSYNSYLDTQRSCCSITRGTQGLMGPTGPAGATIWKIGLGDTGNTGYTGPAGPQGYSTPIAWGITQPTTQAGPTGTVAFNFSGSSWNLNSYFTLKYDIRLTYDTVTNSTGLYPYFNSYSGTMMIYPHIVPTTVGNPNVGVTGCQLNGAIDGVSTYVISPTTTNSPTGRWYWVENYSNIYGGAVGAISNPVYISGVTGSSVVFNFLDPMGGTSETYNYSASFELLQQGYGGTITTSGITSFFNGAGNTTFGV